MTTFACVLCRFVAKRLLREAIQPENNVAAFLEDANAHIKAAELADAFGGRCKCTKSARGCNMALSTSSKSPVWCDCSRH